ncbi:hypothetical protein B0H11DRAFT_1816713 [Mycena galericulata]|nr:hypothetical protein B0H11DRAFT_1816713 [Mycena galericulata]
MISLPATAILTLVLGSLSPVRALPQVIQYSSSVTAAPSATVVSLPAPSASASVVPVIPTTGPYTGGDLTWYTPGEMNDTACGQKHADTDPIAALAIEFFDNYPGATADSNDNPLCGRQIVVTASPSAGAPAVNFTATVADICGNCNITNSVDVTPVLFTQVAPQSVGRLHNITWDWAPVGANATVGGANSTVGAAWGTVTGPASSSVAPVMISPTPVRNLG